MATFDLNKLNRAMQYKSGLATKQLGVSDMKVKSVDAESGTFTAYGNVFNIVDHAKDVTNKGCFAKSIESHKINGTMPKLLAQHQGRMMPIGIITEIKEDDYGLYFEGKFCLETQAGREYHALVKMGAIDQFSIGYITIKERYDAKSDINHLLEVDVKEISIVTFACNEASKIQSVKSALDNGEELTPKMLQDTIREVYHLSKRQAEAAVNAIKNVSDDTETGENIVMFKGVNTADEFKSAIEGKETADMRTKGGIKTKDLGGLSFSDISWGIRKALVKFVGHPDLWLCEVYDGKAYAHFWDYVNEEYKAVETDYTVNNGEIELSNTVKGNINYDPTFIADASDDEGGEKAADEPATKGDSDEHEEEPTEQEETEEKDDSVEDLLSKEDFSTWFTK